MLGRLILFVLLVAAAPVFADPARDLISRIVPKQADQFIVETIPADGVGPGRDVFEIEQSSDRKIILRGKGRFTGDNFPESYSRPADQANPFYKQLWQWEYGWCHGTESYPGELQGDPVGVAQKLLEKWQPVANREYADIAH